MKIIDCTYKTARETEELIWEYTDKNYQFAFEQFGNPTFVKYDSKGKVLDSVSFIHPYVNLRFSRPGSYYAE